MVSGLAYGNFIITDQTALLVLLLLVTIGYALICLYTSQDFQLKVAKLLTIIFALLMAFVTVGVAAQAADDIYTRQHPPTPTPTTTVPTAPAPTNSSRLAAAAASSTTTSAAITITTTALSTTDSSPELPADVSSLYLGGLIGIFLVAALLHLTEAYCLLHGLWYLLCLPSGYLLLIIYSVCNMTDRSWGM